ncbi:MAG: hypothetical protein RL654_1177 [Pseudomonadota bacterium]|jgi:transmembrane sensor
MPLNSPGPNGQPSASAPDASARLDENADEREYEAFAQAQDPLDIGAATWVTRRRSGLSVEEEAELQAWLDADPRHAEAFADMDTIFGDVQQLPDDDVVSLKAALHASAASHAPLRTPVPQQPRQTPTGACHRNGLFGWLPESWGRRVPQAAAAAIAFALVGSGWMGWDHWRQQPTFEQTFATARGQQLSATLPDTGLATLAQGSTLQLDTATQLEARLYRDRREVHLRDGQAMFTVKSDAQRPFHVWAGALRITVIGTRFSVRHTPSGLGTGQTIVSVEEGRVRVARANPHGAVTSDGDDILGASGAAGVAALELTAGQMVTADDTGHLGAVAVMPSGRIAPWRDGRLSFDQTPLAQAIAEFERYGRTGLVVREPAVAALPVGGSYSLTQWQRFAETLPQVLPVRLIRRGEVTEIVMQ